MRSWAFARSRSESVTVIAGELSVSSAGRASGGLALARRFGVGSVDCFRVSAAMIVRSSSSVGLAFGWGF